MDILTIQNVTKTFGTHTVLCDLNFAVPEHSIFGFIGQNGSGKTTTMKLILGLLKPDQGEIQVNGQPVTFGQTKTNSFIGYLPDVPEFYGFLTAKEYLFLCGNISGMPKSEIREQSSRLLELVGLEGANKRIQGFSRGMKQRLGIAQALLRKPKLLICDEPTSALDPSGRKELLNILSLVRNETTVLFSTHILSDVERICDNIALLHHGHIALSGTLHDMKKLRKGSDLELEFQTPEEAEIFAAGYPGGTRLNQLILNYSRKTKEDMNCIMQFLVQHHISIQRIELLEPTLEDLFMEVTQ